MRSNSRKPKSCLALLALLLALLSGCGEESGKEPLVLSGTFTLPEAAGETDAPVVVSVARTVDAAALEENPEDAVIDYVAADRETGEFRIELSERDVRPGEQVYLIALLDSNYSGDVPFPEAGDWIGIYNDGKSLSPAYTVREEANTGIRIDITRRVYEYEASVSGRVLGEETGPVTLVAYAGVVSSSDFSALDFDSVIGFARLEKEAGPAPYTMNILPFGRAAPVEAVQVFALLDKNENRMVDAGDQVGFFSRGEAFSTPFTVEAGTETTDIDLTFQLDVPEPAGAPISLIGTAPGPVRRDAPLYITVFSADDPGDVFEDPYAALAYFYRVPEEVVNYEVDLSGTGLYPGDTAVVAALSDRDFSGGFPRITAGDRVGLVQNKASYQLTTELGYGVNVIPPSGSTFSLDKNVFAFDASIDYVLDLSDAGQFGQQSRIIVLAVHVDGVRVSLCPAGRVDLEIDIDYLLGLDVLPAAAYDEIGLEGASPGGGKRLSLLPALYENILVKPDARPPEPLVRGYGHGTGKERTAYLAAILDKNGNLRLDRGDEVGYHSCDPVEIIDGEAPDADPGLLEGICIPAGFSGLVHIPAPVSRITAGVNRKPSDDGEGEPYRISHFFEP